MERDCLIDGEAIACNDDGLAVFKLIRSYRRGDAVTLCAFDLIEVDGEDLRRRPIEDRKQALKKLPGAPHPGIAFNGHFDVEGVIVFHHACKPAAKASFIEVRYYFLMRRNQMFLAETDYDRSGRPTTLVQNRRKLSTPPAVELQRVTSPTS